MSPLTHELSQTQVSGFVAEELERRPSFRPTRAKEHDKTVAPVARPRSQLLWIPLLGAAACAMLIGGLLVFARQHVPTPIQQELVLWEQSCIQGIESPYSFKSITSSVLYPGTAPGNLAGSRAVRKLVTYGKLKLADLILTLGAPDRVGCTDYGFLPGPTPVLWTRIMIGEGQIEAYVLLPYNVYRLSPDTAVHTLRCYSPDDPHPLRQTSSWRGFTSLAAYPACPPSGTATPR